MATQITPATLIFLIFVTVSSSQPTPYLLGLDVTDVLANADDLKVVANIITMLQIDAELKRQPVFTMFIPVDTAFKELPDTLMSNLHLSLDYTFISMKAHIVRKYFAPELLHSVNTLKPPTLASEIWGTSMYHLNISVIFPSTVTIRTWVVEATIEQTVYSKHPIAIYAVSKVFCVELKDNLKSLFNLKDKIQVMYHLKYARHIQIDKVSYHGFCEPKLLKEHHGFYKPWRI